MSSESRRRSTDDLLAKIDDVVSGHDTQHSDEWGATVPDTGHWTSLPDDAFDEDAHMARLAGQLDQAHHRQMSEQTLPGF